MALWSVQSFLFTTVHTQQFHQIKVWHISVAFKDYFGGWVLLSIFIGWPSDYKEVSVLLQKREKLRYLTLVDPLLPVVKTIFPLWMFFLYSRIFLIDWLVKGQSIKLLCRMSELHSHSIIFWKIGSHQKNGAFWENFCLSTSAVEAQRWSSTHICICRVAAR